VLILGLFVSLLVAWQFARAEERRSLLRFENAAAGARTAVANKMNMQLTILRGTEGLFAASGEVEAAEFSRYAERLDLAREHPGVLGIGFAEAGIPGRPIAGQQPTKAGLVSAIRYLHPLDARNRAALGIDMLSEETRREAMLRAWNGYQPALSGMVRLVQEIERNKQPGFLLYQPMRGADGELRGWVYSPLRGHDLFGSLFDRPEYSGLWIAVFDGTNPQRDQLFAAGPPPGEPRHSQQITIPFAGRRLILAVASTDAFERGSPLTLPLLIGVLGVLITALLAALALQQQRNVSRIKERVRTATTELRETNARLREEMAARGAAEEQLHQAQKMEAVGQLTGGIAHDFNNMLAIVIGSLDFARHTDDPAKLKRLIEQALKGATKAAELTHRLLAFSRRQNLVPAVLDPNALVADMSELLRRTLGGTIKLQTILAPDGWPAFADPAQLESAILNLAVNARDAMPNSGELTIETLNCHLDEAYVRSQSGVSPGDYVLIAVSDTGSGMPPEVRERVLEPFFTTKGVGKGTGLGLSQVFGFVKQSGGHLSIYSEIGRGTTIKLYLPRHRGIAGVTPGDELSSRPGELPRGRADELILAVEDEEDVRLMSVGALRDLGYTVIHASDGVAALRCLEAQPGIRLVFTDIVMPEMDGAELAAVIRERFPDIRLLFTTGYARGAIGRTGRLPEGVDLIAKPFTISQLSTKIRAVLDAPVAALEQNQP
jgi:signal transduction histidine kinase/ActR/RegA family two-component response regulator